MNPFERIATYFCSVLLALTLVALCYDVGKMVYADYLFFQAAFEPSFKDAEKMMLKALRTLPNNEHYEDRAGIVYYEVLALTGDKRAYDNASKLFYRASLHNPYDPQPLIHLVQLDTLAIQRGLFKKPTARGLWACSAAVSLDKNNSVIRKLAEELKRHNSYGFIKVAPPETEQ